MLTELQLFTCTLKAKYKDYKKDIIELGKSLEPKDNILAINSNYIHKVQPDYEKNPEKKKKNKTNQSTRKKQGDGTCFRSCLEFVIKLENDNNNETKVYKPKFYPATGEIQIPGVLKEDFSDGIKILEHLSYFIKEYPPAEENVYPLMLNYKCEVKLDRNTQLLDFNKLCKYIKNSETTDLPYNLMDIHVSQQASQALNIRFKMENEKKLVSIWRSGKINIIGLKCSWDADIIYNYLNKVIPDFVVMKPIPDKDLDNTRVVNWFDFMSGVFNK